MADQKEKMYLITDPEDGEKRWITEEENQELIDAEDAKCIYWDMEWSRRQ
jgi:hypothetical protein